MALNGIRCPCCSGHSKVLWTRVMADGNYSRRRECIACDFRWTTIETALSSLYPMKEPAAT